MYDTYDWPWDPNPLVVADIWVKEDTEITAKVYYKSGDTKTVTDWVYAIIPTYVGLIPYNIDPTQITYDMLAALISGGLIDAYNADLPIYGGNTEKIILPLTEGDIKVHNEFVYDGILRRPFVMYPEDYNTAAGATDA
ncbi:MAG: hypothetical protein Nk1A_8940 [Endomicrobiia bacterium]|nr:MAG: hypothetical protein Nk1A_8940 [Endomicrobiia bacterium]